MNRTASRYAAFAINRRRALQVGGTAFAAGITGMGQPYLAATQDMATPAGGNVDPVEAILAIVNGALSEKNLRAVIARVAVDGEEVVTHALGESLTGVTATPEMHFRNGSVAISYVSTLLLQLVDEQVVTLDDPIARWVPDLPHADQVTLRMLSNMTSGYRDYVQDAGLVDALYADPFRQWTADELIEIAIASPHLFEPGTNWAYGHTNVVILGRVLEMITGKAMDVLMEENIFDPLGMRNTHSSPTAAIPEPVLHAFTSERRTPLGIPAETRFYEESTFWNPSWTLAPGAIQTTNIYDMTTTAEAVGSGALLSPESHRAQVDPGLVGFGAPLEGCPTCFTLTETYGFGLGVVLAGPWILQNPLFSGCGAIEAYLPSRKIAIAVATTFSEQGFDAEGNYTNSRASWEIFAQIAGILAPEDAPSTTRTTS